MTEMFEPKHGDNAESASPPGDPAGWVYGHRGPGWGTPAWGPAPPPGPSRQRWYGRPTVVVALLAGTVGASIGIGHALWPSSASSRAATSAPSSSSGNSAYTNPFSGSGGTGSAGGGTSANSSTNSTGSGVSSIGAKVDPALVDINVTFAGLGRGAATGIVLTSNGEVLTNNHVVEGATSISVTDVGNGRTYDATVVGYDSTDDVAVVHLTNASGLQTAKIGNSSSVSVGEAVIALGNAGGTGGAPTAASGSITALNQAITASDQVSGASENLTGLIQTDADIQSGDSGGALVNSSGQVIGVNTAAAQGYSLSSQTEQGYAVPINKGLSIVSQIESGQGSSTVHVGPTAYLGVYVASSGANGADISGVVGGGPAAGAGLTQGDVITSLGGNNVTSASDLTGLMQLYKPGEGVQIGWTDTSGTTHTASITLGSGPAQ